MQYSFRLVSKNQKSELLLGIESKKTNELIDRINSNLSLRSPLNKCVPVDAKTRIAFLNYNSLKYFLFGLCELSLSDIEELDKLGITVQKLSLMVFSSGLSKMFTSYYDDEIEECEELSLTNLFKTDRDILYKMIPQPYISNDDIKYYKSRYGKYVKMNFSE